MGKSFKSFVESGEIKEKILWHKKSSQKGAQSIKPIKVYQNKSILDNP